MREKVGKEVHTIIYTHGHPDHRGGAEGVQRFGAGGDRVLAPKVSLCWSARKKLTEIQMLRGGASSFGYGLSDEESDHAGRWALARGSFAAKKAGDDRAASLCMTRDVVEQVIDGVKIEMRRFARRDGRHDRWSWLPEKRVLCCGGQLLRLLPKISTRSVGSQ